MYVSLYAFMHANIWRHTCGLICPYMQPCMQTYRSNYMQPYMPMYDTMYAAIYANAWRLICCLYEHVCQLVSGHTCWCMATYMHPYMPMFATMYASIYANSWRLICRLTCTCMPTCMYTCTCIHAWRRWIFYGTEKTTINKTYWRKFYSENIPIHPLLHIKVL